jgi:hypothetical protein
MPNKKLIFVALAAYAFAFILPPQRVVGMFRSKGA